MKNQNQKRKQRKSNAVFCLKKLQESANIKKQNAYETNVY